MSEAVFAISSRPLPRERKLSREEMPNKPARIYVLRDPRDNQIRYVGVTTQRLCNRLWNHFSDARRSKKSPALHWIKSLLEHGLRPTIEPIEEIPIGGDWASAERRWIAFYRDLGVPLKNLTIGGEGCKGTSLGAEARAALSAAKKGWNPSPETRARMSAAAKLRVVPRSTLEKAWAGVRVETRSPETAEKSKRARLGQRHTAETKAKMSAAKLAAPPRDPSTFNRGSENHSARAVIVDGQRFPTLAAAALHIGRTPGAIGHRLKKGTAFYADA